MAYLASLIGDPHVRHRGTIGGSIANNDPAADYPAALLALGATIVTNKREISADKFFKGLFETALKEGEIVTAVTFTAPAKAGYEKFRNPASRYAIVGVFVAKGKDGVSVAVTGAGDDGVFRSKEIEAALAKNFDAFGAGRREGSGERPDGRHPRLARISRQSDRGDGQARGGPSQRLISSIRSCRTKGGLTAPFTYEDFRTPSVRSPGFRFNPLEPSTAVL